MYESSIEKISKIVKEDILPKNKFGFIKNIINDVEYVERYNLFASIYNYRKSFFLYSFVILGVILMFLVYSIIKSKEDDKILYKFMWIILLCLFLSTFAFLVWCYLTGKRVAHKIEIFKKEKSNNYSVVGF